MLSDNVRSTFDIFSTSWDTKKKLIKSKDGISNRMEILLDDYVFDAPFPLETQQNGGGLCRP